MVAQKEYSKNRLGGFNPQVARPSSSGSLARSQVPPGNAVLEALPPGPSRERQQPTVLRYQAPAW